jgi:hypothetical protein
MEAAAHSRRSMFPVSRRKLELLLHVLSLARLASAGQGGGRCRRAGSRLGRAASQRTSPPAPPPPHTHAPISSGRPWELPLLAWLALHAAALEARADVGAGEPRALSGDNGHAALLTAPRPSTRPHPTPPHPTGLRYATRQAPSQGLVQGLLALPSLLLALQRLQPLGELLP